MTTLDNEMQTSLWTFSRQKFFLVLATVVVIVFLWPLLGGHDLQQANPEDKILLDYVNVLNKQQIQNEVRPFSELLNASRQQFSRNCLQFVCKRGNKGYRLSELEKIMVKPGKANNEVTVVSEYFNLGSFRKGTSETRTGSTYAMWVKVFTLVLNNVIMFTDDSRFAQHFLALRSPSNQSENSRKPKPSLSKRVTCVCVVNSSAFWSFSLTSRIAELQRQSVMPRFEPQTTVPLYAVVMHTKYAAMQLVGETNLFDATYLSWLDIGAFRDLVPLLSTLRPFYIVPPPEYDPEKVAYTQMHTVSFSLPINYYFQANLVWVSGSFFFAERSTMVAFAKQYRFTTERTIEMGFASSDQQVLCTMFSAEMMRYYQHPLVHVQPFDPVQSNVDPWFYLAYLCRHTYQLSISSNRTNNTSVQYRDLPVR